MALTVYCPNCRAPMRIDEKQLGSKGKCEKCGEVFVSTNGPGSSSSEGAASPRNNPFANPFGAPSPVEEESEPVESPAGFDGFPFVAPPASAQPTPLAPPPNNPPMQTTSPFEPFMRDPEPSPSEPSAPTAEEWASFQYAAAATPANPPAPEPKAPSVYAPRYDPPPPVVLEMTAPAKAPLLDQKIAVIEAFVVKLASKRTLRGPFGAVLREGKATTRLYVKITGTTGDAFGWSEANPMLALQGATVESTAALVRRFLRPAIEGAVLADVNAWMRRLERASPSEHGPSAIAKAAVESACLDLFAKTLETPLHYVWGGARSKSTVFASIIDPDSPRPIEEQFKRARERGAVAFQLVLDGIEAKDRASLTAAGQCLPEGCTFSASFLRGHPRDAAVRLCKVAESVGAAAIRGVLASESPMEFARLAERRHVSLIADIQSPGPQGVLDYVRHGGVGGVVLQPGLLGWRNSSKAASIAQAAGMRVWLAMQMEGGLGMAATAQFAAALGIDAPILDCGRGFNETHFIPESPGEGPVKWSDQPGVGVAIDEGLLRAAAVEAG